MLSSRPGKYGTTYEGRTRLLRAIVQQVGRDHGDGLLVGVRLNLYDGLPKPDGWGATQMALLISVSQSS